MFHGTIIIVAGISKSLPESMDVYPWMFILMPTANALASRQNNKLGQRNLAQNVF